MGLEKLTQGQLVTPESSEGIRAPVPTPVGMNPEDMAARDYRYRLVLLEVEARISSASTTSPERQRRYSPRPDVTAAGRVHDPTSPSRSDAEGWLDLLDLLELPFGPIEETAPAPTADQTDRGVPAGVIGEGYAGPRERTPIERERMSPGIPIFRTRSARGARIPPQVAARETLDTYLDLLVRDWALYDNEWPTLQAFVLWVVRSVRRNLPEIIRHIKHSAIVVLCFRPWSAIDGARHRAAFEAGPSQAGQSSIHPNQTVGVQVPQDPPAPDPSALDEAALHQAAEHRVAPYQPAPDQAITEQFVPYQSPTFGPPGASPTYADSFHWISDAGQHDVADQPLHNDADRAEHLVPHVGEPPSPEVQVASPDLAVVITVSTPDGQPMVPEPHDESLAPVHHDQPLAPVQHDQPLAPVHHDQPLAPRRRRRPMLGPLLADMQFRPTGIPNGSMEAIASSRPIPALGPCGPGSGDFRE